MTRESHKATENKAFFWYKNVWFRKHCYWKRPPMKSRLWIISIMEQVKGCILLIGLYGCGLESSTIGTSTCLAGRKQNTSTAAVRDLPLRSWAPLWSALRHHWEERCLLPPLPSLGGDEYPTVSPRVCPAPWWSTWESIHSNWRHLRCNNHITYII